MCVLIVRTIIKVNLTILPLVYTALLIGFKDDWLIPPLFIFNGEGGSIRVLYKFLQKRKEMSSSLKVQHSVLFVMSLFENTIC